MNNEERKQLAFDEYSFSEHSLQGCPYNYEYRRLFRLLRDAQHHDWPSIGHPKRSSMDWVNHDCRDFMSS